MVQRHKATSETGSRKLSDDLLRGAAAIAEFMYGDPKERRKVYALHDKRAIPTFLLNNIIHARKSSIVSAIEAREGAIEAREQAAAGKPS
jgi:hypothetical protein